MSKDVKTVLHRHGILGAYVYELNPETLVRCVGNPGLHLHGLCLRRKFHDQVDLVSALKP
jgi:hypothetical protein